MKLYIDDIRTAPEGWQQACTVTDAIRFLDMFGEQVEHISIDHDISYAVEVAGTQRPFPSPENFTAVARYITCMFLAGKFGMAEDYPTLTIHSANPVGAEEIRSIFKDANLVCIVAPESRVNRLESEI